MLPARVGICWIRGYGSGTGGGLWLRMATSRSKAGLSCTLFNLCFELLFFRVQFYLKLLHICAQVLLKKGVMLLHSGKKSPITLPVKKTSGFSVNLLCKPTKTLGISASIALLMVAAMSLRLSKPLFYRALWT